MHCLVRYGAIPEVARCRISDGVAAERGEAVVIESHRGLQVGSVVQQLQADGDGPKVGGADSASDSFMLLRPASTEDLARQRELLAEASSEFSAWTERIDEWNVDVQLIDLEWTLDRSKLILYVLNDRGPECTKLAIQAAAAGLGVVEVQPVSSEGLVSQPTGGGCGSCGCHN